MWVSLVPSLFFFRGVQALLTFPIMTCMFVFSFKVGFYPFFLVYIRRGYDEERMISFVRSFAFGFSCFSCVMGVQEGRHGNSNFLDVCGDGEVPMLYVGLLYCEMASLEDLKSVGRR